MLSDTSPATHKFTHKFVARCRELAERYRAGRCSLHDAVDAAQGYAEARGLLKTIGQHEVQRIMADVFRER